MDYPQVMDVRYSRDLFDGVPEIIHEILGKTVVFATFNAYEKVTIHFTDGTTLIVREEQQAGDISVHTTTEDN
jgi:hypothetical protein